MLCRRGDAKPCHVPTQPGVQVEEGYPVPEGEAAKYMLRRDGCAGQVAFLVYDSVCPAPSHPMHAQAGRTL